MKWIGVIAHTSNGNGEISNFALSMQMAYVYKQELIESGVNEWDISFEPSEVDDYE